MTMSDEGKIDKLKEKMDAVTNWNKNFPDTI
jgi:hypothetical protein